MKTYHIHIKGIVQGVGFRPFVYQMAHKQGLKGWINNTNDGVHIHINADLSTAKKFLNDLLLQLPPLAVVTESKLSEVPFQAYTDFEIIHSEANSKPNLLISPDVAICQDCRNELHSKNDRRYNYPFITCTNCGPRYSIITSLPYDRPNTTMDPFEMCPVCKTEYNNPMERRHYSQTNSCPDCAIKMQLFENGQLIEDFSDLDYIVQQWQKGKVIAIKGIGGYLLTCDATNEKAIQSLRNRKKRPVKPFALMYPDLQSIHKDCYLNKKEISELQSNAAPIVLLQTKEKQKSGIATFEINKGLSKLGIMLPYTPLYEILLQKFNQPIVATSGNLSGASIIFKDEIALKELPKIADIILMNNREIVIPQDDGVVQFSPEYKQKIILRRSRGKAPIYINPTLDFSDKNILATGSMLKSVFGITTQNHIYISQFLGNTESFEAQQNYEATFDHLIQLLEPEIQTVVTDKHPGYFATQFGKEYASKKNMQHIEIQHHKAHFLSVLAENNLLNNSQPVLGIIWDGTGLGDDGQIWGGEFFRYENQNIKRVAHLEAFDFILADKMVKEPRISALSVLHKFAQAKKYLQPKFTETEWQIYRKLLSTTKLKSTSMGRVFDAVSSLLFDNDIHRFEAEASIRLEQKAYAYIQKNGIDLSDSYLPQYEKEQLIKPLFEGIFKDLDKNLSKEYIAAKFHITLVDYITKTAQKTNIPHLAFSGGVFQNTLLVDLIIRHLKDNYFLYFHKELSPNDEGIPLGQLIAGKNVKSKSE